MIQYFRQQMTKGKSGKLEKLGSGSKTCLNKKAADDSFSI